MTLEGKGYFIWQLEQSAPNVSSLLQQTRNAGLKHMVIKVADGVNIHPEGEAGRRFVEDSIKGLQGAGVKAWGWTFLYANLDPIEQARRFAERFIRLKLDGGVIHPDSSPSVVWPSNAGTRFMNELKAVLGRARINEPLIAFSGHRSMKARPNFPFDSFINACTIIMPQIFWIERDGGDPIKELQNSFEEYSARYPTKQFIPTGAAFSAEQVLGSERFFWEARPDQIQLFLNQAAALSFPAVNFWSWQDAIRQPQVWNVIASYPFGIPITPIPPDPPPTPTPTPTPIPPPGFGLPPSPDKDGEAIIEVGTAGYQEGVYPNTGAELTSFFREGKRLTFVKGETQRSTAYAQWSPRIGINGEYLIEAWIPGINATTRRARYHITGVVGQAATLIVELNQLNYSDEWARLGIYELDAGQQFSGMVTLNNLVGAEANEQTRVVFGPIRWRRVERMGVLPGFADGFDSPVGTAEERRSKQVWPGQWLDANPFLNLYSLGYHTGADLNLPRDMDRGAPCYSVADGVVTFSGPAFNRDGSPSGFGNLVVVKHDPFRRADGETILAYSRYAHIKDMRVMAGERVRRGDHLASIWNVGTVAHHLHFDISLSGVLEANPNHWPGDRRHEVEKHYVDPRLFILDHRPGF